VETSGGDSGNVQTHRGLTGLNNKPTGYSASGAYAPGPEEKTKNIPGNHEVKELQKTDILGTAHILRKVLT
jgi:hypothetical protein